MLFEYPSPSGIEDPPSGIFTATRQGEEPKHVVRKLPSFAYSRFRGTDMLIEDPPPGILTATRHGEEP